MRGKELPEDREIFTVHYRNTTVLRELGLHKIGQRLLADKTGVTYVRRLTPDVPDTPGPEPVSHDLSEED
jgi:hypothetical protein